ncbi:MAG: RagB/SusD family nutrient uptake outer membrane protein [Cytophagales bacterium]|nr:RagB/SusD family nutrient uptake outer membrane protein [Cytophagales bacterium]
MKQIQKITTLFIGIMALTSCEDYLEEKMVSGISSSSYYVTEEGLSDALAAAYSYLKDRYYGQQTGMYLTVYGTDTYVMGTTGGYAELDQYTLTPRNGYIKNLWVSMYIVINQCNAVVDRANESTEINESKKSKYVAEARFLRALYYFILVRQFGDVHLTLEETVGVETEANKTSRETIYETAIIPDLEFAVAHLPASQSDYGRATKGAAQFLLSKVYLHRGWLTGSSGDFQKSIEVAEHVINSTEYTLLSDYASLWDIDNQKNSEVIWSVQNTMDPLTNGKGNYAHMLFLMWYERQPGMKRTLEYGRPWLRFNPTPYALSRWDRRYDARYYKTFQHVWYANHPGTLLPEQQVGDTAIFFPGVNIGEKFYVGDVDGNRVERTLTQSYVDQRHNKSCVIITPNPRGGDVSTGYDVKIAFPTPVKFQDPNRPSVNTKNGTRDYVVMRLAEIYLIAAEAYFKIGNNDRAAEMLNVVRRRAAWPGFEDQMMVAASDVTLDFILDERARELLGEGERWYDLTRTETLIERVKLYHNHTNGLNYAAGNIEERHLLRPIPQDQIDKCSNNYPQHAGWE